MTETSRPATTTVRVTARHYGVDLATLTGTGVGGRITRADVLAAAGQTERSARPDGEQHHDDELFDKVWGAAPEQPETDDVFAQVWGEDPEPPETDEVFTRVFGH